MNYYLVVIFNKKCSDSSSLLKLLNWDENEKIIVYDNSTIELGNEKFCQSHGIEYFTQNGNVGLSRAYNYSIENLKLEDDDYLITLDDDTELTDEYLSEIKEKTHNKVSDVIIPIVMSNNRILSPSNLINGWKSKTVDNIAKIQQDKLTAINSGIAIRGYVFTKITYNEELFLDYIDHDFFKRLHNIDASMCIMTSQIVQSYSREEKTTLEGANHRFAIYCKDYKVFCTEANKPLLYFLFTIKQIIRLTIQYHSFTFAKIFMRSGKN